jgi:hypothetical protein
MIASLAAPSRSVPPVGEHGIAADEARIARPLLVAASRRLNAQRAL